MTGMYQPHDMSKVSARLSIGGDVLAAEQLGVCENCRQLTPCMMVEIAPCVRMRLCRNCRGPGC